MRICFASINVEEDWSSSWCCRSELPGVGRRALIFGLLTMRHEVLADEDVRIITSHCRSLTCLKLSWKNYCGDPAVTSKFTSRLTDEGLRHVAEILQQLQVLELASNSTITASRVWQIAANCHQLQSVELNRFAADTLAERPFLTKLVSDQCWVKHLRKELQELPDLAHLEKVSVFLEFEFYGEPDLLVAFITCCPRLRDLYLEGPENPEHPD
eukprot:SM000257S08648  [mRNA]  locus=s257:111661:112319:- [translate_table: standard]